MLPQWLIHRNTLDTFVVKASVAVIIIRSLNSAFLGARLSMFHHRSFLFLLTQLVL